MPKEYVTKSGDTFDRIAYEQMGSGEYLEKLMNANREHLETFIFSANTILKIPDIDNTTNKKLPLWRQ